MRDGEALDLDPGTAAEPRVPASRSTAPQLTLQMLQVAQAPSDPWLKAPAARLAALRTDKEREGLLKAQEKIAAVKKLPGRKQRVNA